MIEVGNIYYFIYLIVAIILLVLLILFTKNKSQKFQKWFIFGLLLSGFILHFMKLLFPEYRDDWPFSLRKVSFENICAVSTLIFPWIFLSKSTRWKDYLYVLGIFGGLGALFYPGPALGQPALSLEVLRCYYCHFVLLAGAILMVTSGEHQLDYHRVWRVPIAFIGILVVILFNEVVLIATGLVSSNLETFLDRANRNTSFIFGPTPAFDGFKEVILFFVPDLFETVPVGPNQGQELYWPIVWLVIPAFIFITIGGFLMELPFEFTHVQNDVRKIKKSKSEEIRDEY